MKRARSEQSMNLPMMQQSSKSTRRRYNPRPMYSIGLPKTYTCRLKYAEEVQIDCGSNSYAEYVFCANDLFDPNVTGTGHQPNGFDELMGFYKTAIVTSSFIKVRPVQIDASYEQLNAYLFIRQSALSTGEAFTATSQALECEKHSKVIVIGGYAGKSQNWKEDKVFSRWNGKRWFGKGYLPGAREFSCDAGSSPTERCFYRIFNVSVGANNPAAMNILVEIQYTVTFTEEALLPQS